MVKRMNKKTTDEGKTVLMSDEYLRQSGVQGGKITGEPKILGSLLVGITFFTIGIYALFSI
jgi:hypothetical protein